MTRRTTPALVATLLWPLQGALAHEGHGLPGGSHWHASDTVGLLVAGGLAALAIWLTRGRK
jgi:hypothetical protein